MSRNVTGSAETSSKVRSGAHRHQRIDMRKESAAKPYARIKPQWSLQSIENAAVTAYRQLLKTSCDANLITTTLASSINSAFEL